MGTAGAAASSGGPVSSSVWVSSEFEAQPAIVEASVARMQMPAARIASRLGVVRMVWTTLQHELTRGEAPYALELIHNAE